MFSTHSLCRLLPPAVLLLAVWLFVPVPLLDATELYRVQGRLLCNPFLSTDRDEPYFNATVELWDADGNLFGGLIDHDDLLNSTASDEDGFFALSAAADAAEVFGTPELFLRIKHLCVPIEPIAQSCWLEDRIELPAATQPGQEQEVPGVVFIGGAVWHSANVSRWAHNTWQVCSDGSRTYINDVH